jgi:hypothetical protein
LWKENEWNDVEQWRGDAARRNRQSSVGCSFVETQTAIQIVGKNS